MDSKPSGRLLDLISLPNEPVLEKYARYFRFQVIRSNLSKKINETAGEITILDYGCGQDLLFYKFLEYYYPHDIQRISYVGIDPLIIPQKTSRITLLKMKFEDTSNVPKGDIIAMFAVLEHVDDPHELLQTAYSKLKAHGVILATTPSWIAKPVLEFFSYILGVIAIREIQEHKQYFSKQSLSTIVEQITRNSSSSWVHRYFELGLNNMLVVQKK